HRGHDFSHFCDIRLLAQSLDIHSSHIPMHQLLSFFYEVLNDSQVKTLLASEVITNQTDVHFRGTSNLSRGDPIETFLRKHPSRHMNQLFPGIWIIDRHAF